MSDTADSTQPRPGSPAWWASRPPAVKGPRRGRPPVAFDRLIEHAMEVIDERGIDGFTMRELAERLGTSTATLYRHAAGREELLVYVVDRLLGEVSAEQRELGAQAQWQDALLERALALDRVLRRHPNLIPVLGAQVPIGPNGLIVREDSIASLISFGFPVVLAARAYATVAPFVVRLAAERHAAGPGERERVELAKYFRSLDPERFAATHASATALAGHSLDDELTESLQLILDGLACALARSAT